MTTRSVRMAVRGESEDWVIAEPYEQLRARLQEAMAWGRFLEVIPLHKQHPVLVNPAAVCYLLGGLA